MNSSKFSIILFIVLDEDKNEASTRNLFGDTLPSNNNNKVTLINQKHIFWSLLSILIEYVTSDPWPFDVLVLSFLILIVVSLLVVVHGLFFVLVVICLSVLVIVVLLLICVALLLLLWLSSLVLYALFVAAVLLLVFLVPVYLLLLVVLLPKLVFALFYSVRRLTMQQTNQQTQICCYCYAPHYCRSNFVVF